MFEVDHIAILVDDLEKSRTMVFGTSWRHS